MGGSLFLRTCPYRPGKINAPVTRAANPGAGSQRRMRLNRSHSSIPSASASKFSNAAILGMLVHRADVWLASGPRSISADHRHTTSDIETEARCRFLAILQLRMRRCRKTSRRRQHKAAQREREVAHVRDQSNVVEFPTRQSKVEYVFTLIAEASAGAPAERVRFPSSLIDETSYSCTLSVALS
jgi:hypothetical protein